MARRRLTKQFVKGNSREVDDGTDKELGLGLGELSYQLDVAREDRLIHGVVIVEGMLMGANMANVGEGGEGGLGYLEQCHGRRCDRRWHGWQ